MIESSYLTNHFLIAMPSLADPNFFHTVTYICEHNSAGALGIVVNRPLTINLGDLYKHLQIEPDQPQTALQPVYLGGPVHRERVFVIHEPDWQGELTVRVADRISVTSSRDVLDAIAGGAFTGHSLIALGYAGWGEGQLEEEMAANAWLSGEADARILFETPHEKRWEAAAARLGVDLNLLSGESGHA
ncbi:MAG: YqgE/AlgH family protein [Pseudomonadota bacterium]